MVLSEVIFLKILMKRVDHFLVEQLLECSAPVYYYLSEVLFFKNRIEEGRSLFEGTASRMFCICRNHQTAQNVLASRTVM